MIKDKESLTLINEVLIYINQILEVFIYLIFQKNIKLRLMRASLIPVIPGIF